jgi:hypothetical protein
MFDFVSLLLRGLWRLVPRPCMKEGWRELVKILNLDVFLSYTLSPKAHVDKFESDPESLNHL